MTIKGVTAPRDMFKYNIAVSGAEKVITVSW